MKGQERSLKLDWSADGGQRLAVTAILLVLSGMCLLVPILVMQVMSEGQKQRTYYDALQQSIGTRNSMRLMLATVQKAEISQRSFILTGRQGVSR